MIKVTQKQDVVLYSAVSLLVAAVPTRVTLEVLADLLAEQIHDNSPELVDAVLAADELNHRIKQRLQAHAEGR